MIENIEYIKSGITIITSIINVLGFYYKIIIKKIDQKVYDKEVDYMKIQTKYNYTNLKEKVESIFEDIKIIKEYIINKS